MAWNSPNTAKNISHQLGERGEKKARSYLRRRGYRILATNYRARHGGEVDIIARDGEFLCFVEVKTRQHTSWGRPAEAVTKEKQRLISRGGLAWLAELGNPDIYFRFDIVEVTREGNKWHFQLLRNAFPLSPPYRYLPARKKK